MNKEREIVLNKLFGEEFMLLKLLFSRFTAVFLTAFIILAGCSSENDSTNNVPVPSVQSIQPIGKSGQIVLQFTQLAGMGANSEVQPEFTLSINEADDYNSAKTLGTHKQVLDGTGMAFLEFTIQKAKLATDIEGPNKKIFEYADLTDGTEYFVWLQACYAGYGCGTPAKMSVVPVPMPAPLTKENIEFVKGDGTVTIKFKNKGKYDEYGLFYNDVKCSYADIYKYAPQLTTTLDHYVISDLTNGTEVTPICLRSQNVNTTGKNAQVVRYINDNVEILKMGMQTSTSADTTQDLRTPQNATQIPANFNIELVSEGNRNVIIKWTGDFEGNDAVNNYEVIYSTEGTAEQKEKAFFDSNNVEHTILNLENGKTYNIKVVAVNNNGANRTESNTIQATPKEMVIDFNNLDTVLGSVEKTFIYAEDVPHSDFWRITEVYNQGGRPNTDRLPWGKETAIGNLYADSFMWYAKNKLNRNDIDFAFIAGEVIANGIESYRTITPRFLMGITNINYINDTLVVANVKGKYLINPSVDYKIDLENYPALEDNSPISIGQTVFGQAAAIYRSGHYGAGHTGAAAYKQRGWLSPSKEVRYTIEYLPYDIKEFETRFAQNCATVDINTGIDSETGALYDSVTDPKNCYSTDILLDPSDKTYPPYATDMSQTTGIDDKTKWGYKRGRIKENSLTINGKPIEPERVYKVLTTKKIANSLYVGLLYADKIEETNVVFWKALGEYIASQGKISPVVDGRVTLSGGVPGNTANDYK